MLGKSPLLLWQIFELVDADHAPHPVIASDLSSPQQDGPDATCHTGRIHRAAAVRSFAGDPCEGRSDFCTRASGVSLRFSPRRPFATSPTRGRADMEIGRAHV